MFGKKWAAYVAQEQEKERQALIELLANENHPFWVHLRGITTESQRPVTSYLCGYTAEDQVINRFFWLFSPEIVREVLLTQHGVRAELQPLDQSWVLSPFLNEPALPPKKKKWRKRKTPEPELDLYQE